MWDVKYNHSNSRVIDMTDSPTIYVSDVVPQIRNGIKWLNTNDEKIYEFCEGDWILNKLDDQ